MSCVKTVTIRECLKLLVGIFYRMWWMYQEKLGMTVSLKQKKKEKKPRNNNE